MLVINFGNLSPLQEEFAGGMGASQSTRQVEGLFESLLSQSFQV
jgi:hypothetical protein